MIAELCCWHLISHATVIMAQLAGADLRVAIFHDAENCYIGHTAEFEGFNAAKLKTDVLQHVQMLARRDLGVSLAWDIRTVEYVGRGSGLHQNLMPTPTRIVLC